MGQTLIPGVSVSQVARRYDVNTNLVFTWRRDPRLRPAAEQEPEPSFLAVCLGGVVRGRRVKTRTPAGTFPCLAFWVNRAFQAPRRDGVSRQLPVARWPPIEPPELSSRVCQGCEGRVS